MGRDNDEATETLVSEDHQGGDHDGPGNSEPDKELRVSELDEQVFYRRKIGMSFADIARELSITKEYAVRLYRKLMVDIAAEYSVRDRDQILAMELARNEDMHRAYYEAGLMGDIDSAKFALELSKHRAKILRLDQPTPEDMLDQTQVIIVSGTKEDFQEALDAGRQAVTITSSQVGDDDEEEDE